MNDRLRNTNDWYEDRDPLSVVDHDLIDILHRAAGGRVLDLGCGLGGYSARLRAFGHACVGLDVNASYVERARSIGVHASVFDGATIPYPDASFDTVFAVEVLEHVAAPERLVREISRVTGGNFIATVPNCSQVFPGGTVVFEHMLDTDHKNFFTADTFGTLLAGAFDTVNVSQIAPVNAAIVRTLVPRTLYRIFRLVQKLGLAKPTHFFRLLAHCRAPKQGERRQ